MGINKDEERTAGVVVEKKKGKGKKIVLVLFSVLLIIAVLLTVFVIIPNKGNIKAAWIWLTTSKEDIESNLNDVKDKQVTALKDSGMNVSQDVIDALNQGRIDDVQFSQILVGTLTLEEALGQNATPSNPDKEPEKNEVSEPLDSPDENKENTVQDSETSKENVDINSGGAAQEGNKPVTETNENTQIVAPPAPEQSKPSSDEKPKPVQPPSSSDASAGAQTSPGASQSADEKIASLVTKMYVLKSQYEGMVAGVVESMKADYLKLPKEQRTMSAKSSIAASYMGKINAMEAQCDAQVNSIVTQLRQVLSANGRDMSLAEAILSNYAAEKENTKAYYLSKYGG